MYQIVCQCDPYNAKKYYHGETVLERDGTTPVKWVVERFKTKTMATDALMKQARLFQSDDWIYFDDSDKKMLKRDGVDVSWYRGEGFYSNCEPVLLNGGESYFDDPCTFVVEKAEK